MQFNGGQGHYNSHETPRQNQLHAFPFLVRIAQGLAFALALNCTSITSTPAADSIPPIEVHVINMSEATPATIARAEAEAGRILRNAGLSVVWTNCSHQQSSANPADPCQQPFGPANVFVRVLSDKARKSFQDSVFGFAVFPALASVYYESAVDLAKAYHGEGMTAPTVLGGVLTHEIGHILLGLNSHSPTGIMQAHWGRKQVLELIKGDLLFTGEQPRQIRVEWQTRTKVEAARIRTARSIGEPSLLMSW